MAGDNEVFNERLSALRQIMDERDIRYEQHFKMMDEKTSLALTSSEKAVTKAEVAQEKRFDNTNEWRAAMQDRDRNQMPRIEIENRFASMKTQQNWTVGICITLILGLAGLVVRLMGH